MQTKKNISPMFLRFRDDIGKVKKCPVGNGAGVFTDRVFIGPKL